MIKRHTNTDQTGFTIIELLIATAVLSTILLLVTTMMVSIGNLYYKGINQSRVQDDVRNIVDQVSQYAQLGNSDPIGVSSGTTQAYCINNVRFTYILDRQLGTGTGKSGVPQSKHVLWRDANPSPGTCSNLGLPDLTAATPSPGGTELMVPNARLTQFSITNVSPYSVAVGIAFGDDDLLCDSGFIAPSDCTITGVSAHMTTLINNAGAIAPSGTIVCKGTTGEQFCATASLSTTVARRLSP